MFAVPGWAVSPSLLAEQGGSTGGKENTPGSKKRKQNGHPDHAKHKVSGRELEKLWDQRFGRSAKSTKSADKPAPRQQRLVEEPTAPHVQSKSKGLSTSLGIDSPGVDALNTNKKIRADITTSHSSNFQERARSKSSSERPPKLKKKQNEEQGTDDTRLPSGATAIMPLTSRSPPVTALTPLQAEMRNKLTSARFRHLNQTLYTSSSSDALALFNTSPELFIEYHSGFSQQVRESWPQNPVDQYIQEIKRRGQISDTPDSGAGKKERGLPRRKTGSCTIADLGCGDAPLARGCQSQMKALKLKLHNFDLHAPNSHVTVADISNLPLRDGEADIAIFCLSLMGTNWISFVEEAWRILRGDGKGEVWVAEVKSRFGRVTKGKVVENSVGKKRKKPGKPRPMDGDADPKINGQELFAEDETTADQNADETDISAFVKVFARRGFQLKEDSVRKNNKMFVSMSFIKSGIPTAGKHKGLRWSGKEYQKTHDGRMRFVGTEQDDQDVSPAEEAKVLKPCVYKTR